MTFDKSYAEPGLYICFPDSDQWFLYPHQELLEKLIRAGKIGESRSWEDHGLYSFPYLSKEVRELLEPYRLAADPARGVADNPGQEQG